MKPIDAIVVTLILGGKIQGHWVYSIENGDPERVNGSLVVAQLKMEELIKKHHPRAKDLIEEDWVEIFESKEFSWNLNFPDNDKVILAFSVRETP